jgi:RNA polymerase sigma-70 factor (ECF subfamily)
MNEDEKNNSFQTFYNEHHNALFRFCITKVRDRHVAVDLVQESFIRLWDYVKKQDEIVYPKALLYRIAYNLVIDWSRKKKAQSLDTLMDNGAAFEGSDETGPDHVARDDMHRVLSTIEKLPEPYRDAITMRYVDGLSVSEIADLLDEEANTVSVRIHRGMEKLKIELQES